MEFPNAGEQCSDPDCNQLDFLPFTCDKCKAVFCLHHFTSHTQECINLNRRPTNFYGDNNNNDNSNKCSTCGETAVVPIICEKCEKPFCVKHRHFDDCPGKNLPGVDPEVIAEFYLAKALYEKKREREEQVILLDKQINDNLKKAKQKGNKTAGKVQLMRLKNRAKGNRNIPTNDRIYFTVHYKDKSIPLFIAKTWSVGRAIDAIALDFNIQTNQYKFLPNNTLTKPQVKKLRLFKADCNEMICENMATTFENLLKLDQITDGDDLTICYVEDAESESTTTEENSQ